MKWRQKFLVPARRPGGIGKEITREFAAPTREDAIAWVKAEAERTSRVLLGGPKSFFSPRES